MDQIEDLLIRLGRCHLEIGAFHDGHGSLRLIVPFPTWEDVLRLALDEIQSYGSGSVQVMRRMKALLENLIAVLPGARHAALRKWEQRLQDTVKRSFDDVEQCSNETPRWAIGRVSGLVRKKLSFPSADHDAAISNNSSADDVRRFPSWLRRCSRGSHLRG